MDNRQAFKPLNWTGVFLVWISACLYLTGCSPVNLSTPAPTPSPLPSSTPPVPTPTLVKPTPTPEGCLEQRGQVHRVAFDSEALPQFMIYLPACYDADPDTLYPVLYLLHGQGFEDDQWIRLGVAVAADDMMWRNEIPPYLIVMPFDKASWRSVEDDYFGEALVAELIPFVDEHYRTLARRDYRAIGGLSRGAGWAIRYGLTRWELFSAFGGHSAAIFYKDNGKLDDWLAEIPAVYMPEIYLDIGDQDKEHGSAFLFTELLVEEGVSHEWRLFSGNHDESYWSAHVDDYLRWYGGVFS